MRLIPPGTLSAWSREFFLAAVCTCDLVHVPVVQHHWQDDLTLSSRLRLKKFPRSAGRCSTDAFSGSPNGRTLVTTAKTGFLSSPLVMNPRLGAKERSKSTGWSSSTVICVRGCGPVVSWPAPVCSPAVSGARDCQWRQPRHRLLDPRASAREDGGDTQGGDQQEVSVHDSDQGYECPLPCWL